MIIMLCTMLFHNLWCHLLVDLAGMGVRGASLATMITYFLNFFLSLIYIQVLYFRNEVIKKSWHMPNKDSFKELWPYFKRAMNCCFLLILEWWCFEIIHLASTYFGVYQNAASVILGMYSFLCYMLPFGIQIAVGCLVG